MHLAMLLIATIMLIFAPISSYAEESFNLYLERFIPDYRAMMGKPLLETSITFNNEQNLILERLTPQGALFFYSPNNKVPGETFDALRQRAYLSVSIATCSGAKDLEAKISNISIWESVDTSRPVAIAAHIQRLLELMNSPSSITSPSSMRAPKVAQLKGVVFEYIKGDTLENLSLLSDSADSRENLLKLNWQISNVAFCPK